MLHSTYTPILGKDLELSIILLYYFTVHGSKVYAKCQSLT
jgi:hypothetical protein